MVDWQGIWNSMGEATVSLTDHAKGTATTALFILIVIILLLIALKIFINWVKTRGQRESLNLEQREWLRIGGYNVRKKKLRHLYGSVSGKKLNDLGSIMSYIEIENKKTDDDGGEVIDRWVLIATRGSGIKFYYLPSNIIVNRSGDLIVNEWNFVLDKTGRYYIKNMNVITDSPDDEQSELKTLQALSKYTLDAIKSNPIHKTRLRERNLANASQESNWQMMGGES